MTANPKYLEDLYLRMIKKDSGNQWRKVKEEDHGLFVELARALDLMGADPQEYMEYQFKWLKGGKSPSQICSVKSLRRYEIHQKMKNKYITPDYSIEGDFLYVNRTYKAYDLARVKSGVGEDPVANFAVTMCDYEIPDDQLDHELWEACEYTICKFKYKEKTPPTALIGLAERCRIRRDNDRTKQTIQGGSPEESRDGARVGNL